MLSIKNNLMAQNAARHLGNSYNDLSKSVERLSSGLRINSAKDDAAGLAVRELIRADVAKFQQGSRNGQDGISLVQTAEGGLAAVDEILIRMEELAQQAKNGTYSADQLTVIDGEFQSLVAEVDRISASTDFNDVTLLAGATTVTIDVGAGATIDITGYDVSASGLALDAEDLTLDAAAALTAVEAAIVTKDGIRAEFGFNMGRLEQAINVVDIQAENLMTAESRISDVDVATEMASLTRSQVLAQAGIAMLAQANSIPQMALQLL